MISSFFGIQERVSGKQIFLFSHNQVSERSRSKDLKICPSWCRKTIQRGAGHTYGENSNVSPLINFSIIRDSNLRSSGILDSSVPSRCPLKENIPLSPSPWPQLVFVLSCLQPKHIEAGQIHQWHSSQSCSFGRRFGSR